MEMRMKLKPIIFFEDDSAFDVLLYKLASLEVTHDESHSICPVCADKFPMKIFAQHVYECLDELDDFERMDLGKQIGNDSEYAKRLARESNSEGNQYFATQCPICNMNLEVGTSINIHVNECLDHMQQLNDKNEDVDVVTILPKFVNDMTRQKTDNADVVSENIAVNEKQDNQNEDNNNNENKNNNGETAAVKGLNRNQMIECAKSLLNEQKGSKQYEDMLKMFGTLGLNANNMKTVIDSTPKENNNNSNINHSNEKNQKMEDTVFNNNLQSYYENNNSNNPQSSPKTNILKGVINNDMNTNNDYKNDTTAIVNNEYTKNVEDITDLQQNNENNENNEKNLPLSDSQL